MKRYLLISLAAILAVISFSSCSQRSQLELAAKIANRQCPMPLGDGLTVILIDLQGNEFQYHVKCDEKILSTDFIDMIELNKSETEKELRREVYSELYSDPDGQELLSLLRQNNINIVYIYTGSITGKTTKCYVNISKPYEAYAHPGRNSDVRVSLTGSSSVTESEKSSSNLLAASIKLANNSCPTTIDEGMVNTSIIYNDDVVIYNTECDEAVLGEECISLLRQNRASLKADLIADLTSEEGIDGDFIQLLKEANAKITYRYIGVPSGKKLDITISPSEIM